MTIAALAAWAVTAAAGVYLLAAVMAAQRAARSSRSPGQTSTPPGETGPPPGEGTPPGAGPRASTRAPPPIPRTKVSTPPGEHPLLEFCHPALGITSLACWFAFVATQDRAFAWIAIAVLAVTIGAGLGWMVSRAWSARRRPGGGPGAAAPAHRIVLHGLAAAATCGLAIIAILAAGHG